MQHSKNCSEQDLGGEQEGNVSTKAQLAPTPYALALARVVDHAVDTFGSQANADDWLNRPNRLFANKTPLQILTRHPEAVEEELVRIDHGMFV